MKPAVVPVWLIAAGLAGAAAVALGAYGAHGFAGDDAARAWYDTALLWHGWHALALLALGLCGGVLPRPLARLAGLGFVSGIVLFAGSLYALALTGRSPLPMAAPIGGFAFLVGWLALAAGGIALLRRRDQSAGSSR